MIHNLTVPLLAGNGVPVSEIDSPVQGAAVKAVVEIAPAYQFQREDGALNWAVVNSFTTDTASITITGMEDADTDGADVIWQMRVKFLDRANGYVGGDSVLFKFADTAPTEASFPDNVILQDVALPPEYGPTWAVQAEAAAVAAQQAQVAAQGYAAAAQAVPTTNDGIIAGRINTPGSATATALSATFLRQPIPALEAVPATVYGDSYGQGAQGASQGSRPFNRLCVRHRTLAPSILAVAGTRMDQVAAAVAAGWTPNSVGLVGFADGVINDEKQYGDLTGLATTREAFRAALAFLTARASLPITDAGFIFGPGWSAGVSSTVGSYVDIGFTGDELYLRVGLVTGSGGTATIKNNAGTTVATISTGGFKNAFNGVQRISGFGAGNHTVRLALASGSITLVGALVPSPTPPLVVWDKPGQFNSNAGEYTRLVAYLAECAGILGAFPTVIPVDMGAGWDYATMISSDATHRNDLGNLFAADRIEAAIRGALGSNLQQGLNALGLTTAASPYTSPTPAYTTPGATAPAQVTGLTIGTPTDVSVPVSWARPADGGATIAGWSLQYRVVGAGSWTTLGGTILPGATSATITGLTATTDYEVRVAAINPVGTGAYSTTATFTTTVALVVYFGDTGVGTDGALTTTPVGGRTYNQSIVGLPWTRVSNTVACSASSGVDNDLWADSGVANGTLTGTRVAPQSDRGLLFCAAQSGASGNFNATGYIFYHTGGAWQLKKRTAANAYTTLATATSGSGGIPATGTNDVLTVVKNAANIKCYVNGLMVIDYTDSSPLTGTRWGLWTAAAAATNFKNIQHDNRVAA